VALKFAYLYLTRIHYWVVGGAAICGAANATSQRHLQTAVTSKRRRKDGAPQGGVNETFLANFADSKLSILLLFHSCSLLLIVC